MMTAFHTLAVCWRACLQLCLVLFIVAGLCAGAGAEAPEGIQEPAPEPVLDGPSLEPFMDGLVHAHMDAYSIPGLAIAITEGDRIVLLKGYGFADTGGQVPLDARSHLFRVASISKAFAWMSLLQLSEAGKLDLEADVNQYLDFEIPNTFPGHPIRVRNLATHTTGFEAVNIGTSARSLKEQSALGDALKRLLPRRVRLPDSMTGYSNYGAALAGYIVERVSEVPYPEYLETHVFEPLDMRHSSMRQPPPGALADQLVTGYTLSDGQAKPGSYSYLEIYPDGALQATAEDMAKFALALLNPDQNGDVLSAGGFKAMRTRQFANIPQVAGMTFGLEQKIWNGRVAYGHGGDMDYFSARLLIFPEEDMSIFIALNTDSGGEARDHIIKAIMDRFYPATSPALMLSGGPVENASDDLARNYIPTRRNFSTIEKLFWPLMAGVSIDRISDSRLNVDFFGSVHPYTRVSEGVYHPAEEALGRLDGYGALIATRDPETGKRMLYFSQNGSFAFEEPPLLERMSLQGIFLLSAILLVGLGAALLLSALLAKPILLSVRAWVGIAACLSGAACAFVFLPLLISRYTSDLVFGIPRDFFILFGLPVAGLVGVLTGAALIFDDSRREPRASRRLPAGAGLILAGMLIYAVQLSTWNMLGYGGLPA